MNEIIKMQQYLTSKMFYIDYQYENEQVWVSRHRGETIEVDLDLKSMTIIQPFECDLIVNTLDKLKQELN